jgi:EmrB/QacA subfamily drug resistance transporter
MTETKSSWQALTGLSIAAFLGCLDLTIVNTALPAMQSSFMVNETQLQWVMNILLLALTAFMVIAGKLADRYGKRLLLYIGMMLFAITSLGAGLSTNFTLLIFFRFFQGIAIAILYTAPVGLIPHLFPKKIGAAMGILIGMSGFGLAIGPVIGGILTSLFNWSAIFFINLPLIALAFVFCLPKLPSIPITTKEKIDLPGALLIAPTLFLLIFATVQIPSWGFFNIRICSLYLLAFILLLLFIYRENHTQTPIVDFQAFRNRRLIIGLIANFFLAFFYAIDFFFIPLHLHQVGNYSLNQIGLFLLPATMMVAILSPFSGKLCDRVGSKIILITGYVFLASSAFLQILTSNTLHIGFILVPYILFGMGWACILSPSLLVIISALPKEQTSVAMGMGGTLHNFGGTLGLAIGATLGYTGAMQLIAITSLAALGTIIVGSKKY